MNECFTDPIFGNFSVERKRQMTEGEVSYSVSGDLQVS